MTRISILALFWLFLAGTCSADSESRLDNKSPREIHPRPSILTELANNLVLSSETERRNFARIVLIELSAVYEEELKLAGQFVPRTETARRKLSRWRHATGAFLIQLQGIYRALDSGATVGLHVDKKQRLLLIIEGSPVVMSGPRIGQEKALKARIVKNFCRIHECSQPLEAERYAQPKPDYSDPGTWILGQKRGPRYETKDGLSFGFSNIASRITKEQACLAIVIELRELVDALMKARESGEQINWAVIKIESIPLRDDHRIILNERGDYLRLDLHSLGEFREFWRAFVPWVRARTNGDIHHLNFLNSERLFNPTATHH